MKQDELRAAQTNLAKDILQAMLDKLIQNAIRHYYLGRDAEGIKAILAADRVVSMARQQGWELLDPTNNLIGRGELFTQAVDWVVQSESMGINIKDNLGGDVDVR